MLMRSRATTRVLLLLCLMDVVTDIGQVTIGTAAGHIKQDLGLSNTQLRLIFSACAYPFAVFQVIGGLIGDRGAGARPSSAG